MEPLTIDLAVERRDFVLLPGLVEFHATRDTLSLGDASHLVETTSATPLAGGPGGGPKCGLGAELAPLGLMRRLRGGSGGMTRRLTPTIS